MNSRTRGPDWSWCWSSRRTSCSGWPQTACCACWVESAGWPSPGAPPGCCPPRERSELQARSQLPHLNLALLSKDLKTTSLVRPKPVLGVNFHLGERYVPGQKSIERQVFLHLTIFANGRLVFGKGSRDDLIKKYSGKISSQVEKSCRRKKHIRQITCSTRAWSAWRQRIKRAGSSNWQSPWGEIRCSLERLGRRGESLAQFIQSEIAGYRRSLYKLI